MYKLAKIWYLKGLVLGIKTCSKRNWLPSFMIIASIYGIMSTNFTNILLIKRTTRILAPFKSYIIWTSFPRENITMGFKFKYMTAYHYDAYVHFSICNRMPWKIIAISRIEFSRHSEIQFWNDIACIFFYLLPSKSYCLLPHLRMLCI